SVQEYSIDDVNDIYDRVILVSKTNIVNYQMGRTQIIKFSEFGPLHFDNNIINSLLPFIYLIFFILAILIYVFEVGAYFFAALLYSLVGLIVSALSHANLRYATVFKTAIYGKVTVSILYALLNIIPITIPGYFISGLSILITCAYVVYGTLSHSSDAAYEEAGLNNPPMNF
ncbi:MAG: DUF1189 family protein, partial [Herbinix sp.]|nr:DUF1189 family protein [Herbinix sp.]